MKMCTLYYLYLNINNTCTKHFEKLTTDNFNFVNKLYVFCTEEPVYLYLQYLSTHRSFQTNFLNF